MTGWEAVAARTAPHFQAAMMRAIDHGVPIDKAAFLGLVYFSSLLVASCTRLTGGKDSAKEVRDARDAVTQALSEIADRAEANAH